MHLQKKIKRIGIVAPSASEESGVEGIVGEKFIYILSGFCEELLVLSRSNQSWTIENKKSLIRWITVTNTDNNAQKHKQPFWYDLGGIVREDSNKWQWAQTCASLLEVEHHKIPLDVIVTRYLPADGLWAGMILKKRLGLPWLHIFNDPYPGWCQPSPGLMTWNFARIARDIWLQRKLLKTKQSFFVYPAYRMRECSIRKTFLPGKLQKNIGVLYNVGIPNLMLQRENRITNEDRIVKYRYLGVFSGYRNPYPFLIGWRSFSENNRDVILEIYSPENDRIKRIISEIGSIKRLELRKPVSYERACELIQEKCVLVQIDPFWAKEGIWIAGKVADYLSTNNIICGWTPEVSEIRELCLKIGQSAFWAKENDARYFTKCFQQAFNEFRNGKTQKNNRRPFSEEVIHEQLNNALLKIV